MNDRQPIDIPYGDHAVISLDPSGLNIAGVLEPADVAAAPSVESALRATIDAPIESPGLGDLGESGDEYLIVADDMTRATPVAAMIQVVADVLNAAGVNDSQIRVLIATGTPPTHDIRGNPPTIRGRRDRPLRYPKPRLQDLYASGPRTDR